VLSPLSERRALLRAAAALPLAAAVPALAQPARLARATPNEDLMQEHGLVGRVMLVYSRATQLLGSGQSLDPQLISSAAQIVMKVIHAHHELEEEQLVFPVMEKQPEYSNLVAVLRGQHNSARTLTTNIVNVSRPNLMKDPQQVRELTRLMQNFVNMYLPHGDFEDTVIYPTFRQSVGADRYAELGAQFEKNERQMGGDEAFRKHAIEVGRIERALGIELADYTKQAPAPTPGIPPPGAR
jgi:hemerythrin-like domain-containing protein